MTYPSLGVIKGSEDSLRSGRGCVDRETYLSLSGRAQATFVGQRDAVYDCYERYEKKKKQRGDYDAADRYIMLCSFGVVASN